MHLLPCHPCGTDVRIVVPKHVRERSRIQEAKFPVKWQVFAIGTSSQPMFKSRHPRHLHIRRPESEVKSSARASQVCVWCDPRRPSGTGTQSLPAAFIAISTPRLLFNTTRKTSGTPKRAKQAPTRTLLDGFGRKLPQRRIPWHGPAADAAAPRQQLPQQR
jgi:hypothetical protein